MQWLFINIPSFLLHYVELKFIYWILEQQLLLCPSWCSLQHEVPYYKPLKNNNFLVLTTLGLWFVEAISQTITFCFITKILELQTCMFSFKLLTLKLKLSSNVVQLNVLGLDIIVNTFLYIYLCCCLFFSLKQAPPQTNATYDPQTTS